MQAVVSVNSYSNQYAGKQGSHRLLGLFAAKRGAADDERARHEPSRGYLYPRRGGCTGMFTALSGVVGALQAGGSGGSGIGALLFLLVPLAIAVVVIAGFWKTFTKAGEPGWAAIIPIYNVYVMVKVSGNPWWWLILFFLPLLNLVALFKISIDVAKAFGRGLGFGIGLAMLSFIFWPLLGFGDYEYVGRNGTGGGNAAAQPA